MAKRKFGGYTIDYKKISVKKDTEHEMVICKVQLKGNIEIGIDIDDWTWRGDWLTNMLFKEDKDNYRLMHVENNYISYNPEETNVVTATYRLNHREY